MEMSGTGWANPRRLIIATRLSRPQFWLSSNGLKVCAGMVRKWEYGPRAPSSDRVLIDTYVSVIVS
jgi:DNA-binding transcriptional regulator YiaG